MRPTVSEQLAGVAAILTDVIADRLDDAYARDVLLGVASTLKTLSETWHAIPEFLRWDSLRTAAILELVGQAVPPHPLDSSDIRALEQHHIEVRERLEQSIPIIVKSTAGRLATAAYFRERVERFSCVGREKF
ncbi:hypothetical protein [Mycobacterium simiae]|uniref:hypothetical protein n=1 Tax=Mycobacterium simiae TaxID=1784 RepID=UPI0004262A91|nr:hypothetical protein [Mycobacterium simiae]PLV46957.1 hypothetical protein X011_20820 [Mycobacterium tuberculosis variant microti OV254]BBX43416.1 hypothetical protein MSIM_48670 [Mycobacterium simiae]